MMFYTFSLLDIKILLCISSIFNLFVAINNDLRFLRALNGFASVRIGV
jgi:hypothetical protein